MGNLYALRDLDGDGRVFGDNEAAGSLALLRGHGFSERNW